MVLDYGVLFNINPRAAIGGSWLVSVGDQESITGPELRYRRWLDDKRSLDLGLGAPIAGDLKRGSVIGVVTYNPLQWLAVGVRPEYARRTVYDCGSTGCLQHTTTRLRVSGGAELSGLPGISATLVGGAVLVALFLALIGTYE